jgi:hypothetical protein
MTDAVPVGVQEDGDRSAGGQRPGQEELGRAQLDSEQLRVTGSYSSLLLLWPYVRQADADFARRRRQRRETLCREPPSRRTAARC